MVDEKKAAAAKVLVVVQAEAEKAADTAKSAGTQALLLRMDQLECDSKLCKAVVEAAQKIAEGTVVVGMSVGMSATAGKVMLMVSSPKALHSKLKAGDVVKAVMPTLGGKGGGKPNFAQGQGSKVDAVDAAIAQVLGIAKEKLGVDASKVSMADCTAKARTGPDAATLKKMSSEQYLAEFKLQENLEELVNMVLKQKPANPYEAMADFLKEISFS